MIGILPEGLFYQDLSQMLETDIITDLTLLEETGLIQKEEQFRMFRYSLTPFVEDFISTKMD